MYLENGESVEMLTTFEGGVVVKRLFDESECPEYDEGEPFIVQKVYEEPPTSFIDSQIQSRMERLADIDGQLSRKREELAKATLELRTAETSRKALSERLFKDAALQRVADFIDGKITHFVTSNYGRVTVMDKEMALASNDKYERDIRLVTLFGKSNGDLQWGINQYRDGSGSWEDCWICFSLEEAMEIAGRVIAELFNTDSQLENAVASADKLGLPVPQSVRDKIIERTKKNIESNLTLARMNVQTCERSLAELLKSRNPDGNSEAS